METAQHYVYLAIPGKQFCWGTVTGVINSTSKHVAHPFNGGLGFSGVIDFNILWCDAINNYEAGRITHFAMLHGDIEPDSEQRWLDILLDIMDEKGAELVSAHSPIKDHRGLTSSGICDPSNPWGAYRRFTQREILHELPDVFDNVAAGYPDRPLLHNTACWVADLRKPVFSETTADGELRTIFRFPERIRRNAAGLWEHEQESEDWVLSRELWERGARNTWITSRVRFKHLGGMTWANWVDFGQYKQGDENTAHRWREERDALPLALTQMLEFELGSECNLGTTHAACPNLHPNRYGKLDTSRELDDDTIVNTAVRAYRELGFSGMVGWIYYNEPLLQAERMFALMERIKQEVPRARFILWTNGSLIPEECEQYRQFEQIVISNYGPNSQRGIERLAERKIACRSIDNAALDNRLVQIAPVDESEPCLRPFVELIIDNHGNTHLCCYDWQGKGTWGNVFTTDFGELATKWREMLPTIAGETMSDEAPAVCRGCGHRWSKYQQHDEAIVERARRFRATLESPRAPTVIMDESGCAIGEAASLVQT
jgi:hypothetical protein